MSYKIAIASGKGGTGKTTVAVNLFYHFSKTLNGKVQLVDCDVEEPNDLIFFDIAKKVRCEVISQLIPQIDKEICTYCRKCAEYCEFNAIVVIPPVKYAEVNSSLCHSCGACLMACMQNAISEHSETIGTVNFYSTAEGNFITEGKLKIGSAMQTMLIKELKRRTVTDIDLVIYDAPPGTSCPVVETMSDTDFVVLVAEPTPFGLHDLKLMVRLMKDIQKPYGVIVNKSGIWDNTIYRYLEEENVDLLGEIPFSREFAAYYSKGNVFQDIPKSISGSFKQIITELNREIIKYEGDHYFKW